jgi:hypothetical protein
MPLKRNTTVAFFVFLCEALFFFFYTPGIIIIMLLFIKLCVPNYVAPLPYIIHCRCRKQRWLRECWDAKTESRSLIFQTQCFLRMTKKSVDFLLYQKNGKGRLLHEWTYRPTFLPSDERFMHFNFYLSSPSVTYMPITVAARSKAWTVFARLNTWVVDSNPTRGMDVCVGLFCIHVVLCEGRDLAKGFSPIQGVLPTV